MKNEYVLEVIPITTKNNIEIFTNCKYYKKIVVRYINSKYFGIIIWIADK
jgi:hypothetical protein